MEPESLQEQFLQQNSGPIIPASHDGQQLTRQQKRLRRQKLAKLYKRAAAQESSHSEAAEDFALQQAYEEHLRSLQQQHPAPASVHQEEEGPGSGTQPGGNKRKQQGGKQPQQLRQQQQGQPCGTGGGSKRRRRGGSYQAGAAGCVAAAATGSVDTLASSAALAVPVAQPVQLPAQISVLSGTQLPSALAAHSQELFFQQQVVVQHPLACPACGTLLPGIGGVCGAASQQQQQQQQNWSAPAMVPGQVLVEQQEGQVTQEVAAKMAGVCRLDLSVAALLIGSRLDPAAAAAPAAAPGPGLDGSQAGVAAGQGQAAQDATEPAAAAAPEQVAAKRQRRPIFVHGNYHRYYGYRFSAEQQQEDPRLAAFERKWFARRRCLDVGCNEGLITLALATRFQPRSMLGVDIDGALIARACRHLREARSAAVQRTQLARRAGVPADERREAKAVAASLAQTLFVHTDFLESDVQPASLDTITCLSVTKWVHLNRGDDGLRALFAAFHRALVPGGLLLLEPQPWKSYRSAASKVTREQAPPGSFFHRQKELQLRPAQFADYLCGELGFRLVKHLGVEESAAGFDRPLLLLRKAAS